MSTLNPREKWTCQRKLQIREKITEKRKLEMLEKITDEGKLQKIRHARENWTLKIKCQRKSTQHHKHGREIFNNCLNYI